MIFTNSTLKLTILKTSDNSLAGTYQLKLVGTYTIGGAS